MTIRNFTLQELIYSPIAIENHICNMPSFEAVKNLELLCENILEPLRLLLKKPINISSGFRNTQLNSLAGGVPTSEHLKGMAVDIWISGMSSQSLFDFIRNSDLLYSQLIFERNLDLNPIQQWNHISFDKDNLIKENLIATKSQNKWTYQHV